MDNTFSIVNSGTDLHNDIDNQLNQANLHAQLQLDGGDKSVSKNTSIDSNNKNTSVDKTIKSDLHTKSGKHQLEPFSDIRPSAESKSTSGSTQIQKQHTPTPSMKKKVEPRIFKIIVIGDSNVGKTCLTYRFCEGKFPSRVEATIGVDFREKTVDVGDESIKMQLWDTAGQERFRRSMVPHYYRNVHAVVYVYDITKRSSFSNLSDWLNEYAKYSLNIDVPRLLVGNKCDLVELLEVGTNEAQLFADKYQMPLFETSAMDDTKTDHVESIFMTLAHKLKESKPMMGRQYRQSSFIEPTKPVTINYTTIGQEHSDNCSC